MNDKAPVERPYQNASEDEISLVDLAKILVKRWKLMAAVFAIVVLGALAYVLLVDRQYDYVSIYQVAEQAPRSDNAVGALEAPGSVVAKVNNLYLGPVTRELRESAGLERLPFEVAVSNPSDTLLVRLSSEAREADSRLVAQMHEAVLARITEGQHSLLEQRRASLEQQLQSAQRTLEAAEQSGSERASELIFSYTDRIANIEDRLTQLNEGQVVQVAVQSLEPTGTRRSLIMALAVVLGGMLSVISVFLFHFAVLVRQSLD
jgi:uncharacterized protein involved in exopolysaccharide biosynthesis